MEIGLAEQAIHCVECDTSFTFSIAEQVFYAERGVRPPVNCPDCRARKRAERHGDAIKACESPATSLLWNDSFNTFNGSASNSSPTPRRGTRPAPRLMFQAVCSSCGKKAEVPFEPRGGRPVYCRECFGARRSR